MTLLRCIDQSGVATDLQPDTVSLGFQERQSYHFVAAVDGACLYIDEAPAEPARAHGVHGWRWQPGFYAGQVLAELVGSAGQRLAEYRFDVTPDKGKLGADVFNTMVDDLYAFDPVLLLGTEAAQGDIGTSGDVAPLLLAYARLRRYGEGLLAALGKVAAQPLTRLQHERVLVPCHRVRRLDGPSAQVSMRRRIPPPSSTAQVRRRRALRSLMWSFQLIRWTIRPTALSRPPSRQSSGAAIR